MVGVPGDSFVPVGQKDRLVKEEENVLPDVFAAGIGGRVILYLLWFPCTGSHWAWHGAVRELPSMSMSTTAPARRPGNVGMMLTAGV